MEPTDDLALILTEVEVTAEPEPESAFQPMSEDDIESIVASAVDDAIDFISSDITERRIKAQRYFNGEVDIGSFASITDTKSCGTWPMTRW